MKRMPCLTANCSIKNKAMDENWRRCLEIEAGHLKDENKGAPGRNRSVLIIIEDILHLGLIPPR